MKSPFWIWVGMFCLFCACCEKPASVSAPAGGEGSGRPAAGGWDEASARAKSLLERANASSSAGNHAEALGLVRQAAAIADRFPGNLRFRESILDFQQFLLAKAGAFPEALAKALELDDLSGKLSPRRSPWNGLKIAEAYLGLGDRENALAWIEKAVYERGFIRRDVFDLEAYAPLRGDPRFRKAVGEIERRIGINLPAKEFAVTLLDGSPFSLSGQRGKVVLVDFWDVKCAPCRKEMPNLTRLHREFAVAGLVIIGISLDTDRALLRDFLKEISPGWKMACSFQGWNDPTARLYSINATPSSWLIDRRGILRHVDLRGEALSRAVRELL